MSRWVTMRSSNSQSDRKMRIAHVAPQLDVGGMERLLIQFGLHADRSQFDLHFVSLTTRGDVSEDLELQGWPVTTLEMQPGLRPTAVWQLHRFFRHNQVDLVHTHNNKSLVYAAPAARLAGVRRIIHTRHGQNFGCSPRELLLMRCAARLTSRLVAVSKDSAKLAIKSGFPRSKVMHILNGIDVEAFPYSPPVHDGPILMAGRLSPEKSAVTLLRSAEILHSRGCQHSWEIAGDGPCRQSLEQLAQTAGLSGRVTFLGQVRGIQDVLRRASVFVLPSLTEGISLALLEAMAIGLPVVATRVGGNPEVVIDGETGVLVPPGDAEALADAIERILSDRSRHRRMSLAARERVEEFFDVKRMVAEYERLYTGELPKCSDRDPKSANIANRHLSPVDSDEVATALVREGRLSA